MIISSKGEGVHKKFGIKCEFLLTHDCILGLKLPHQYFVLLFIGVTLDLGWVRVQGQTLEMVFELHCLLHLPCFEVKVKVRGQLQTVCRIAVYIRGSAC